MKTKNDGLAAGLKIVGVCVYGAGPKFLSICGIAGADVFNIENFKFGGDFGRNIPPRVVKDYSPFYLTHNLSVKSVGLDYSTPEGMQILRTCLKDADIFVTNIHPKMASKFGLSWEQFRKTDPDLEHLVCVSIAADHPESAESKKPGVAPTSEAKTGIMDLQHGSDGLPQRSAVPFLDYYAAEKALAFAALAVHRRTKTGSGCQISVSLTGSAISTLSYQATLELNNFHQIKYRDHSEHQTIPSARMLDTKTGPILVMAVTGPHWKKLCEVIERKDLLQDERFADMEARLKNRTALSEILIAAFKEKTASEWKQELEAHNIPCEIPNTIKDLLKGDHLECGNLIKVDGTPLGDEIIVPGCGVDIEGGKLVYEAPHFLGYDTQEFLAEFAGFDEATIADLHERKIISSPFLFEEDSYVKLNSTAALLSPLGREKSHGECAPELQQEEESKDAPNRPPGILR
jgi:crotonobetainyl-CoA:carnitine CoA-transferase CaiB-like acyl-CoA transferase